MNQVHLIGGEKGGVGKSVMSRVFAQYCIDRGIPFQGFDSDRSHGPFMRFYQDFADHVELDAKIIELPKLHQGSMHQVDQSNSSFWAAIHAPGNGDQLLGILDRQGVRA